jgi:hypothetical protein
MRIIKGCIAHHENEVVLGDDSTPFAKDQFGVGIHRRRALAELSDVSMTQVRVANEVYTHD